MSNIYTTSIAHIESDIARLEGLRARLSTESSKAALDISINKLKKELADTKKKAEAFKAEETKHAQDFEAELRSILGDPKDQLKRFFGDFAF